MPNIHSLFDLYTFEDRGKARVSLSASMGSRLVRVVSDLPPHSMEAHLLDSLEVARGFAAGMRTAATRCPVYTELAALGGDGGAIVLAVWPLLRSAPFRSLDEAVPVSDHRGGCDTCHSSCVSGPRAVPEQSVPGARYLVATGWGHVFPGSVELELRWVWDLQLGRMAAVHVREGVRWYMADDQEVDDLVEVILGDSVVEAPLDRRITATDTLPRWAG